jgi:hypothetical protein
LHPNKNTPPNRIIYLAAATVILLVAAFFRFYRLADHPLGIFFDPAINGLDAVRLWQRGGPVIFFPTNGGREALFMVLLLPVIRLFGTTPFSLRVVTTALSLLTAPLLIGMLADRHSYGRHAPKLWRWLPLLGGLILATSYWHIIVSRLGQRPIMVPLVATGAFWLFLKGWHTRRHRWFIFSGLLMGVAGHTYSAGRLLPVILGLALLPEFFQRGNKQKWVNRLQLPNLLLFLLAAGLVYLPMAVYLWQYPAQFTARAGSVMVWNFLDTPADIAAELGRNALRVISFFGWAGSPNPIFGLPHYPGLPLTLTPFLLIGLLNALRQWRSFFFRLTALWWFIGIAPSVFAIEAPHPLRMIAATVPTAILTAEGLRWGAARLRLAKFRRLTAIAVIILMLLPIPGLVQAYFVDWTSLQSTRGVYDYGAVAIRDEILRRADDDTAIYLPQNRFNDSTLLYYLSGKFERVAALTAPPAEQAIVIAPERNVTDAVWVRLYRHSATVLPPLTPAGQEIIQNALTSAATAPIRTINGKIAARLAALPTDPGQLTQAPTQAVAADFGPVSLTGAAYHRVISPTATAMPVTLYWQANHPMRTEYEIILQLVDDDRQVWATGSGRPTDWVYPTTFWRSGLDEIAAPHLLTATGATPLPMGRYWLAVSVFDPARQQRLPLTGGLSDSPDTYFVGPLKVPPPAIDTPPFTAIKAMFGDTVALTGYALNRNVIAAGEPLEFMLQWQAVNLPPLDYTIFAHLLDSDNNIIVGNDSQPLDNRYPTTVWATGEQIIDPHTIPTAHTLPPGQYRLAIGLYHQPSGERLSLSRPDQFPDPLGQLILPHTITIIHETAN